MMHRLLRQKTEGQALVFVPAVATVIYACTEPLAGASALSGLQAAFARLPGWA